MTIVAEPKILPSPSAGLPTDYYLVLEGGGAKGVAHIGAYKAIISASEQAGQWPNLRLVGVAGTSVGALVASLIAVGHKPNDLIEDGTYPLAKRYGVRGLDDLFGRKCRLYFSLARAMLFARNGVQAVLWHWLSKAVLHAVGTVSLTIVLAIFFWWGRAGLDAAISLAPSITSSFSLHVIAGVCLIMMAYFAAKQLLGVIDGVISTSKLSSVLDAALCDKYLETLHAKSHATDAALVADIKQNGLRFKHLDLINQDLRIVATNIKNNDMAIFSKHHSPEIKIANAVAASISIPILFKKMKMEDGDHYQDGGLVSSFPVWIFDSERTLNAFSWVVAIALDHNDQTTVHIDASKVETSSPLAPLKELFYGTLYSSLFGRSAIDARPHDRLAMVKIKTRLGILDFDKLEDPGDVKAAVNHAEAVTRILLGETLCSEPHRRADVCRQIATEVFSYPISQGTPAPEERRIRVILASPQRANHSLRTLYGAAYIMDKGGRIRLEQIPDDRLILPVDSTTAGRTFIKGEPDFDEGAAVFEREFTPERDFYRRTMARSMPVNHRPVWRWTIPVYSNLNLGSEAPDPARGASRTATMVVAIEGNWQSDLYGANSGDVRFHAERRFAGLVYSRVIAEGEAEKQRGQKIIEAKLRL